MDFYRRIRAVQRNILEYLEHTVGAMPEAVALSEDKGSITFSQLHDLSRRLGSAIARRTGCVNRPVAVFTERKIAPVTGFLGALQSGNFYVPVDCKMPRSRMDSLMRQLQPAAMVLSRAHTALAEPYADLCPMLFFEDAGEEEIDDTLLQRCRSKVLDVDPAYILFTSGSTGAPKGIVVSHRAAIDFTDWYADTFAFTGNDILGNQSPFFFDLSMRDLYTMLKSGTRIHLIPQKCFSFPKLLQQELTEQAITGLNWAASAFHLVANSGILEKGMPQSIHTVIIGGEALQAKQLNIWRRALPNTRFINVYGPTETTVDCCYYFIDREFADGETIPIGKACENMEAFLLSEQGCEVPRGESGELCIRGSGLAQGYYGDWDKTTAAFTQDPRNKFYPDRIYHTGDIAVEDEDGNFRFLARKDNQIKHGGYRIELGEIETGINGLAGVQAAICFFEAEKDKIHCVYQGTLTGGEIAAAVRALLPKYMLPNIYHQISQMPYTPSGKIDRNALKKEYLHDAD